MAYKPYHPDRQRVAGPRMSRAFLMLIGIAALIGLLAGIVWVVAGLLNFHVFR
jgi:hypothetical protein